MSEPTGSSSIRFAAPFRRVRSTACSGSDVDRVGARLQAPGRLRSVHGVERPALVRHHRALARGEDDDLPRAFHREASGNRGHERALSVAPHHDAAPAAHLRLVGVTSFRISRALRAQRHAALREHGSGGMSRPGSCSMEDGAHADRHPRRSRSAPARSPAGAEPLADPERAAFAARAPGSPRPPPLHRALDVGELRRGRSRGRARGRAARAAARGPGRRERRA